MRILHISYYNNMIYDILYQSTSVRFNDETSDASWYENIMYFSMII